MLPKVIVSTDIGGNDNDDAQSLIHALLYANDVDYRGFVTTSTDVDRNVGGTSVSNDIIDAYEKDLPNLRKSDDYPDASDLRDVVVQGAFEADWPGDLSAGAQHIIDEANAASPDNPVYLLAWGPIHDIARALYEEPGIVDNVRVISVAAVIQDRGNQDAYDWLRNAVRSDADYRDLFWINAEESFRGMYIDERGRNDPSKNLDWVKENVAGQGALGDLFYSEYTFDLYGGNSADGLKMGDTPSLLYLLDNVSNDNPALSSWGGSFQKSSIGTNTWVDKSGEALGQYEGAATVFEHRDEVWGDFAARLEIAANGSSGSRPISRDDNSDDGGNVTLPEPEDIRAEEEEVVTPEEDHIDREAVTDSNLLPITVSDQLAGPVAAADEDLLDIEDVTPEPTQATVQAPAPIEIVVPEPVHEMEAEVANDILVFDDTGSDQSDKIKGGSAANNMSGAGGDDKILGRGGEDVLDGGSGDDKVIGGAGDDRLIYVAGDNEQASDRYLGSSGVDTLELYVTRELFETEEFQEDVEAFVHFADKNADTAKNGGVSFAFDSFDLTVQSTEKLEVFIYHYGDLG